MPEMNDRNMIMIILRKNSIILVKVFMIKIKIIKIILFNKNRLTFYFYGDI